MYGSSSLDQKVLRLIQVRRTHGSFYNVKESQCNLLEDSSLSICKAQECKLLPPWIDFHVSGLPIQSLEDKCQYSLYLKAVAGALTCDDTKEFSPRQYFKDQLRR
jgi:hypothetical protein